MPRPTSRFASGRCFDASIAASRLLTEISPKPSNAEQVLRPQAVDVARVVDEAALAEEAHRSLAEPLDVHRAAAGEVDDALARWTGQSGWVQNVSLSPSSSRERARAAGTGRSSGTPTASSPSGRSASTGPTTSGMTSPALRTMTVSPGRTSLACTWSSLCSVASPTVDPPTNTGSSMANGVAFPVRPIDTMMSLQRRDRSSGGNL